MSAITLSLEEIEALTQYKLAAHQLNELRRQGFYRARMGRLGVVLERAHYEAVCASADQPARPRVIPPKGVRHGKRAAA